MIRVQRRRLSALVAFVVVAMTAGTQVQASLIANEPFLYGTAGDPSNGIYQGGADLEDAPNTSVTGGPILGFTGNWISDQFNRLEPVATGLTHAGLPDASGGSTGYVNAGSTPTGTRGARRAINDTASGVGTVRYLAALMRTAETDSGNDASAEIEFGTYSSSGNSLHIGLAGNQIRLTDSGWGDSTQEIVLVNDYWNSSLPGTTMLLVAKVEIATLSGGDDSDNGFQDLVSFWLNPTDLSSDASMSLSADAWGSLQANMVSASWSADELHLKMSNWNSTDTPLWFDELRTAETSSMLVTSSTGSPAIPEPASVALTLIAGGGLLVSGRRRCSR